MGPPSISCKPPPKTPSTSRGHALNKPWPGINKPGGVARVTKIHKEGEATKYDVVYVMGGSEKQVDACYVGLPQE